MEAVLRALSAKVYANFFYSASNSVAKASSRGKPVTLISKKLV